MKEHQLAVLNFFKGLAPGRLLDAGSGTDALGRILRDRGFEVFSLDLYESPGVHMGRFVRADLNATLPFADNTFDYILCSESLQYLENHAGLFREFGRLLKKGGSLAISIPNILNASSRLYFLQRGYYPSFKPVRTVDAKKEWDTIAYNPISLVDIIELIKRNGFEINALKASRLKFSNLPLYPVLKTLYWLGLIFEENEEKAEFLKKVSSKEALLGDHLIIQVKLRS